MHVFMIAAVSVDGFIDRGQHEASTQWTSAEDKKFFSDRTKAAGVMIVGRTTFETFGRALAGRKIFVLSSQPKPEKYAAIPDGDVEYTSLTPAELLEQLETTELMDKSGTPQKITEVAVCGGSSIYAQFMNAGLIQTMYLTMESVIFGAGIKLFAQKVTASIALENTQKLSDKTMLLTYKVTQNV